MLCDEALKRRIEAHLARFRVASFAEENSHRAAAVAVVVAEEGHGPDLEGMPHHDDWRADAALILTRRSSALRNHAGQWALPGGRIDEGESPEDTALRELQEEVGLTVSRASVMGRLDDFLTRSGFVITPVVVWGGEGREVHRNQAEVESIHRIPVDEFLRADAPFLEDIPESTQPVLRMPVGATWIAAPTAAIIYQFREVCILGRETRVAHYEQPTFAWQ